MLELTNINKSYGNQKVLNNINCCFEQGKLTCVIGPSGSSKTTLLGIASCLLKPDSGKVILNHKNLLRLDEVGLDKCRLDNFSFVFQTPNLFNALTVLQNVEIILRWGSKLDKKTIRNKAIKALSELGLESKLNFRPNILSGGEKQRVSIARAIVKDPIYIFADEPTSALDWTNGEKVIKLFQNQINKKIGVVVVTHDHRLEKYADKIIKMDDGKIVN